ncbi:hypothetical protein C8F04DRAFT_520206 [Mycena alexandri]|uniref:Uncharacterized protein n=1 Tax=Mycena alexandri TaxID=1745969 RepID=A0AAD6XH07_9AGAR|nr:hypothetical protein C8F04DRAFT_520206 [Mycena alexandri]
MLRDAFRSLSRFSNLQTLQFDFLEGSWPEHKADYFSHFVDIQLDIWRSLENTPLPRLQTLSIGSMITHFPRILDETDPFLALFRTLDTLSISVVTPSQPLNSFVPEGILRFNDTLSCMLTAARNITSLELGLWRLLSPTCEPFAFEALVFPALTALSLHNIMLQGAPDPDPDAPPSPDPPLEIPDEGPKFTVETFILNHSATLKHLALYNCAVSAMHGSWHRVFKRFGAQLPELIEFASMTSVSGLSFPYARDIGRGRYLVMPSIRQDPQDVAALEHFQTAVMFRRNSMAFDPVPSAGLKSRFRCPPRSAIFNAKGRQALHVSDLAN